ncbi:MAG: DUF5700 domain-containing putative Zn-dependent protease [Janthinobacterium lividum]
MRDVRNYAQYPAGILEAHEMHYRLRTTPAWQMTPTNEPLLTALYMALNEGLADLTDKRVQLTQSADTADSDALRRWLLAPVPAAIQKIDSTIQVRAAGGPATPLKLYRRLTNGTNGHLPGFFMAYTILQNGYLKPMLEHADDPIAFVLLYQKAAKKDRQHLPKLAPTSVRYLRQLARK